MNVNAKLTLFFVLCACSLFLTACVTPEPEQEFHTADLYDPGLLQLDPVLSETWPGLEEETDFTDAEIEALRTPLDIDYRLNDFSRERIQEQFVFFLHHAPASLRNWFAASQEYLPYIRSILAERGMPEDLAAMSFIESGMNPRAFSRAGACGLWQFMPRTGTKYGLRCDWWMDERRDPFKATEAAADYLTELYGMFNDWTLAIAAYNCGEAKIQKAVEATGATDFFQLAERNDELTGGARLKPETLQYVPRFLAMAKLLRNHDLLGFDPIDMDAQCSVTPLDLPPNTDLVGLCRAIDLSWDDFSLCNSAFRRPVSPPEGNATAYIPSACMDTAAEWLTQPEAVSQYGFIAYTIRSGDSWYAISRRYNTPVDVLKATNNRHSNLLHPGEQILIPVTEAAQANLESSSHQETATNSNENSDEHGSSASTYLVRSGDTLGLLSQRFGVSVNDLLQINNLRSPQALRAGVHIRIPNSRLDDVEVEEATVEQAEEERPRVAQSGQVVQYVVQDGDNLWTIAQRFGCTTDDLMHWNELGPRHLLHAGDVISILPE